MHRRYFKSLLYAAVCCVLFCGCGQDKGIEVDPDAPLRDNTPQVLVPAADQVVTYGNEVVHIDASHTDQGYIMVQYLGSNPKVKLQLDASDGSTYTYLLSQGGTYDTFPFSAGNGGYTLNVLENVQDDFYSMAFSQALDVQIADEFTPYLYPNQYVNFSPESMVVSKGQELADGTRSDLEVVQNIYHYVIENVSYDTEKATNVSYGYVPNVDETLSSGKGICFDYASLMCSMLRSQKIPTKLEVGYAGDVYHAWISTYIDEIGWIDNIIQFDGTDWQLMDPTFAATGDGANEDYIGDGTNYTVKYSY